MNVFLRREGLGLDSIRNIMSKMANPTNVKIFRVDLRNPKPVCDYAFSWGVHDLRGYSFDKLVNTPEAIIEISNKGGFRKKLADAGFAMPTTKNRSEALDLISSGKKLVVRPYSHFGGSNTYLASCANSLDSAIRNCGTGWYASEFIPKVKEFRAFVAQGRVAYIVEKIVPDTSAIAWNVHQGGRFENVRYDEWNLRVAKIAVEAFNLTSLDFGAVDIIVDSENKPYVLEINSAPAMTSEYWTTCVAKVFDYIIANGKDRIPLITDRGNWRKFIHPAIQSEALIPRRTRIESRIQRREVQRTRTVQRQASWSLNESVEIPTETLSAIVDALESGYRSGQVYWNATETYTDYEDVEVQVEVEI
jgi:hypothetical protein